MKKLLLLLLLSTNNIFGQKLPCASNTSINKILEANPYDGLDIGISRDSSFREDCLSHIHKKYLLDLVSGKYSYKNEIESHMKFVNTILLNISKKIAKKDTLTLKKVLDSLKQKELEELKIRYSKTYINSNIPLFVGTIYFYEAIPYLQEIIKDSSKYRTTHTIKLALARLKDPIQYSFYLSRYKNLAKTEKEFRTKIRDLEYINTLESKFLLLKELKNNKLSVILDEKEANDFFEIKAPVSASQYMISNLFIWTLEMGDAKEKEYWDNIFSKNKGKNLYNDKISDSLFGYFKKHKYEIPLNDLHK